MIADALTLYLYLNVVYSILATNITTGNFVTMNEIITSTGYQYENYSVTTEDGYILTIGRIPHQKTCTDKKEPIILLHGVQQNAYFFLVAGPSNALGFLLADSCYDVWLPNTRGTFYSTGHVNLNQEESAYWHFSYDEEGKYDLKPIVDLVLRTTNVTNISFLGFSKGCPTFMIFLHYHPAYINYFKGVYFMAPVTTLRNYEHPDWWPPKTLYMLTQNLGYLVNMPISYYSGFAQLFKEEICKENSIFCDQSKGGFETADLMKEIYESKRLQWDPLVAHQVMHFIQIAITHQFKPYDYGRNKNLAKYGKEVPSAYNISRLTSPVHIIYGREDAFATVDDIHYLISQIPDLRLVYQIPQLPSTHGGFLTGRRQKVLIYNVLMKYLDGYNLKN